MKKNSLIVGVMFLLLSATSAQNSNSQSVAEWGQDKNTGSVIFVESFDDATFHPIGWLRNPVYQPPVSSSAWNRTTIATWTLGGTGGAALCSPGGAMQSVQRLITPQITIPSTGYELTFWSGLGGPNRMSGTLEVVISTTDVQPTSFTTLRTLTIDDFAANNTLYPFSVSLDAYTGPVYLAFFYTGANMSTYAQWIIDEVRVATPGATIVRCSLENFTSPPASGLNSTTQNVSIVILNTGDEALSNFNLRLEHTLPGASTPVVTTETFTGSIAQFARDTFTFSTPLDVSASWEHTIRVVIEATGNISADTARQMTFVNISCGATTFFPWVEDFESTTFPSSMCWVNTGTTSTVWTRATSGYSPQCTPRSGSAMATINMYYASQGARGRLFLPPVNTIGKDVLLSFWMYRTDDAPLALDSLNIYFNSTQTMTGATLIRTIHRATTQTPTESANRWYNYTLTLPQQNNLHIIFEAVAPGVMMSARNFFLDEISIRENLTVTFNANGGTGTMTPQSFIQGVEQTLNANTFTHPTLYFSGWATTPTGAIVADNKGLFTTLTNTTLHAVWMTNPPAIITVAALPTDGGEVAGAGEFHYGKNVTVTATPNIAYNFTNWTDGVGGLLASTNAAYTFTSGSNRNLVANFAIKTFDITLTSNAGGTVTPVGNPTANIFTINYGADTTYVFTPNIGWRIDSVWINGTYNSTAVLAGRHQFRNVISNQTIRVKFIQKQPVTSFPWLETFDANVWPPKDWMVNTRLPNTNIWLRNGNITFNRNGSAGAATHGYSNYSDVDGWLISPEIVIPTTDEYMLEFWSRFAVPLAYYKYCAVRISSGSSDPADGDFEELYKLEYISATAGDVREVYQDHRFLLDNKYLGKSIYVAFVYRGMSGNVWFVDDVSIFKNKLNAEFISIVEPVSGLNLTTTENITITIKNNATTPLVAAPDLNIRIEHQIPGVTAPIIITEPFIGNIAAGATMNYTLATTLDLSASGSHTIIVSASDGNISATNLSATTIVSSFPWTENFEGIFPLPGWRTLQNSSQIAFEFYKSTQSRPGSTGTMSAWRNPNTNTSMATNQQCILITPRISIPANGLFELEFWSRISSGTTAGYEGTSDSYSGIWISEASTLPTNIANFNTTFTELMMIPVSNAKTDTWEKFILVLNHYIGKDVYIAFKHISNLNGHQWFIDDMAINPYAVEIVEVAITEFITPTAGDHINLPSNQQVKVRVENFGTQPISNFEMRLQSGNIDTTEIYTGTIDVGGEIDYPFVKRLDLSETGTYSIIATVIVANNENVNNGSETINLTNQFCPAIAVFPWTEGFDAPIFPPTCWLNQSATNSLWRRVTTGTIVSDNGTQMVDFAPKNGTGMIEFQGSFVNETTGVLISPLLNINQDDLKLSFYMSRYNHFNDQYLAWRDRIDVYVNNTPTLDGATLLKGIERRIEPRPTFINNGWHEIILDLPKMTEAYIIFEGTSGASTFLSIYLDEISITKGYTVTFNANGGQGTMDQQSFIQGVEKPLHANAFTFTNKKFQGWATIATGAVVYEDEETVLIAENTTLYAVWKETAPEFYTITVWANPSNAGEVAGGGPHDEGANATVIAHANTGWEFINWTENGVQVSADPSFTFTVTSDKTLVANFEPLTFTITATSGTNGDISPKGATSVTYGANQEFVFTPNQDYEILQVLIDGEANAQAKEDRRYTFVNVIKNHTISVSFMLPNSIQDLTNKLFYVYPNPANDILYIQTEQTIQQIVVLDMNGRIVMQLKGNYKTVDLQTISTGNYIVRIYTETAIVPIKIAKQ